jgi:hypothetical protein
MRRSPRMTYKLHRGAGKRCKKKPQPTILEA